MFIILCPRFLSMNRFIDVCKIYCNHPILDIEYFMMIHYMTIKERDNPLVQPILDSFIIYTKLPQNINSNQFYHFNELRQKLIEIHITGHSNIDNHTRAFFVNTKDKLLNHNRIKEYLKKTKIINGNNKINKKLDCSTLYLKKLKRFLNTAQFIVS